MEKYEDENIHYDYKTYNDYHALSKNNTAEYLMLSELIDNSIGSAENKWGSKFKDWEEELHININMKMDNNEKEKIKKEYEIECFKNLSIEVTDNAFGMNKEELIQALKINKKNQNSNSSKNIHGRGLKQSAFYFGNDLEIYTCNGVESNYISLKISECESINERVYYDTKKCDQFLTRGTKIKITKINSSRKIAPYILEEIEKALSQRYKKCIQGGKIKITITYQNAKEEKSKFKEPLALNEVKVSTLGECFNNTSKEYVKKMLKIFANKSEKFIKREKSDADLTEDIEVMQKTRKSILDLFKEDYSQETLNKLFKFKLMLDIHLHNRIEVHFFRLSKNKQKAPQFRGFTVYQGNRALVHGPIKNDNKTYLSWLKKGMGTGSTEHVFAGYFDIDRHHEIETTTDKSKFNMPENSKAELDSQLFSVFKIFNIAELAFRGRSTTSKNEKINKNSIENNLISRYKEEDFEKKLIPFYAKEDTITVNQETKQMDGKFMLSRNGEEWEIQIVVSLEHDNKNDKIISSNKNETIFNKENKFLRVLAYRNCSIWKNADEITNNSTRFYSEIFYPIIIQFCILIINLRTERIRDYINALNNTEDEEKIGIDFDDI